MCPPRWNTPSPPAAARSGARRLLDPPQTPRPGGRGLVASVSPCAPAAGAVPAAAGPLPGRASSTLRLAAAPGARHRARVRSVVSRRAGRCPHGRSRSGTRPRRNPVRSRWCPLGAAVTLGARWRGAVVEIPEAGMVVLVPTDLSEASLVAATYASGLVSQAGGTVVLLRVLSPVGVDEGRPVDRQMDDACVEARWWFATFVPQASRRTARVEALAVPGHPEGEIPAVARSVGITMIVMPIEDRRRAGALTGSAEVVRRRASCPVLTIRVPTPAVPPRAGR